MDIKESLKLKIFNLNLPVKIKQNKNYYKIIVTSLRNETMKL